MKIKPNYLILPTLVIAILVILIAMFFRSGEGVKNPETQTVSLEDAFGSYPKPKEGVVEKIDLTEEVVRLYGNMASRSNDFLVVNRAEIKTHEIPYGRGVQYGIVINKFTNELTEEHANTLYAVIGKLLKDTTKYVLAKDPSIAYVAVQVLHPELWAQGFARETAGHGYLYVAKRNDLLAFLEMEDETLDWVGAARRGTVELVDSTILRDLLDKQFEKNRQETEKGFEFPR